MATYDGQYLHPTIPAVAAAYLFHARQNHLMNDWDVDFSQDELSPRMLFPLFLSAAIPVRLIHSLLMRIALGADHGGFALKQQILHHLRSEGHDVFDAGTDSPQSTDYPDYAETVSRHVAAGDFERGILVCTTGMGMCIAANKVDGVRAALAMNADEVRLTRAHNDANVLALGAKYTSLQAAEEMITIFLTTPFEGGRHQRRVDKIARLEAERP